MKEAQQQFFKSVRAAAEQTVEQIRGAEESYFSILRRPRSPSQLFLYVSTACCRIEHTISFSALMEPYQSLRV